MCVDGCFSQGSAYATQTQNNRHPSYGSNKNALPKVDKLEKGTFVCYLSDVVVVACATYNP